MIWQEVAIAVALGVLLGPGTLLFLYKWSAWYYDPSRKGMSRARAEERARRHA